MNNVNKTLYIPLYGKAYVSRRGIILSDPRAEEIWAAEGFDLKGKSRSKWLAYYMGMRSAVFDRWVASCIREEPEAVVLHIGCGLDSRCERVTEKAKIWYDVDFPEVIGERSRFFPARDSYRLIGADARDPKWLAQIPGEGTAVVVMEGVSMYLEPAELTALLKRLKEHFARVRILMDCYTEFAAKASRYKNPINDVGVTRVFGLDDPRPVAENAGLRLLGQREMTPGELIAQLPAGQQKIFRLFYAGAVANSMYRLYELES